jgi:hypothetical protein
LALNSARLRSAANLAASANPRRMKQNEHAAKRADIGDPMT